MTTSSIPRASPHKPTIARAAPNLPRAISVVQQHAPIARALPAPAGIARSTPAAKQSPFGPFPKVPLRVPGEGPKPVQTHGVHFRLVESPVWPGSKDRCASCISTWGLWLEAGHMHSRQETLQAFADWTIGVDPELLLYMSKFLISRLAQETRK